MSKQKTERKLKDNEAQAFARVVQTTPRKLNLIAGMIRGMGAQPALAALCKLGLVYLGVSLLMMVITRLAIRPEVLMQMMPRPDAKTPPDIQTSHMLALFGVFLLDVAVLVTLCFAAPLTYWKHMGPGKATFYSFFAVIRTARPFLVLLAAWFAIFFGVCIVAALLFGDAALGRVVLMWLIFLFVLPMVTALIYVVARGRGMAERQHAEEHEHIEAQEAYIRQAAGGSPADQIARAKQLLADGTITEPEFAELKQQALGHFGGRHAAA